LTFFLFIRLRSDGVPRASGWAAVMRSADIAIDAPNKRAPPFTQKVNLPPSARPISNAVRPT